MTTTIYRCKKYIFGKAAYTFNECWVEQKRKCLGKYTPLCVRHSCACIPTDVHMRQMGANSVHLFIIRQEFPLTFAHLPPTWQTNMTEHVHSCLLPSPHLANAHIR